MFHRLGGGFQGIGVYGSDRAAATIAANFRDGYQEGVIDLRTRILYVLLTTTTRTADQRFWDSVTSKALHDL